MEAKNKLENPEELASYITNRRKLRRRGYLIRFCFFTNFFLKILEVQAFQVNQYKRTSLFSRGSILSVCPSDMDKNEINL